MTYTLIARKTGPRPLGRRDKVYDTGTRPPEPGRSGWSRRASNSARPALMVFIANPVALDTAVKPPQPKAAASAPAHCRRIRSSMGGDNA